ncbi:MAG: flagellar basal body L-ring protein FlgH [Desulfatiglandales bacterium]
MVPKRYFILFVTLIIATGCGHSSYYAQDASRVPAVKKIKEPQFPKFRPPKIEEGSLWSDARGLDLYPDIKARKVGDIVTVRIVEDPEAKLNANTKTSRSSNLEAKLAFLGYMQWMAEKNPRLAQTPGESPLIKANLASSFDGQGSSNRDGHVKAYISAVVVGVLPNGNLYINGKREIKVNNEIQYITLSGVVRPEDVNSFNEVSSAFVADLKVNYSGIGPLADKQNPGWLGRIIDYVWPF